MRNNQYVYMISAENTPSKLPFIVKINIIIYWLHDYLNEFSISIHRNRFHIHTDETSLLDRKNELNISKQNFTRYIFIYSLPLGINHYSCNCCCVLWPAAKRHDAIYVWSVMHIPTERIIYYSIFMYLYIFTNRNPKLN